MNDDRPTQDQIDAVVPDSLKGRPWASLPPGQQNRVRQAIDEVDRT